MAREAMVEKATTRARLRAAARRPLTPPLPMPLRRLLGSRTLMVAAAAFVGGSVVASKVVHDNDEVRIRSGIARVARNVALCVGTGRHLDFSEPAPLCLDRDGSRVSTADVTIPPSVTAPAPVVAASAPSTTAPLAVANPAASTATATPANPASRVASAPKAPLASNATPATVATNPAPRRAARRRTFDLKGLLAAIRRAEPFAALRRDREGRVVEPVLALRPSAPVHQAR